MGKMTPEQKAIDQDWREQARQMGKVFGGKWDFSASRKAALRGASQTPMVSPLRPQSTDSPYHRDPMAYYNAQAQNAQAQRPPQQAAPQAGGGQGLGTKSQLGYQTGFNADRVAVNSGDVLGRLGQEGQHVPQQGSATGIQAAADLSKSLAMNDQAQMRRGIEKANAQQSMNDKVTRSELMQSGLSNQAKIYGDMAQRQTSQIGLAAQLQEAMIRNRFALAQALLGNS